MAERAKRAPRRPARTTTRTRRTHPARKTAARPPRAPEPQPVVGGGGSSGFGPIDDDGDHRPERPHDGRTPLLIALGIIGVGLSVIAAKLVSQRRA